MDCKTGGFSTDVLGILRPVLTGGVTVREVCQSHGVSENTFYTWKRKYAGMESDDIRKLKCQATCKTDPLTT